MAPVRVDVLSNSINFVFFGQMLRAPDHAQGFFSIHPLEFRPSLMNPHWQMVHVLHSASTDGSLVTTHQPVCGKDDSVET
jgi:hypothetical protein